MGHYSLNEEPTSYSPEVSSAYDTYFLNVRDLTRDTRGLSEEEIEAFQINAVEQREKQLDKVGCSELLRAMAIWGQSEEGDMPELTTIWQSIDGQQFTESVEE